MESITAQTFFALTGVLATGLNPASLAHLLTEPVLSQVLGRLLREQVQEGYLDWAQETARIMGRKLSIREIQDIIRAMLVKGPRLQEVQEAAALLGRGPNPDEFRALLQHCVKLGDLEGAQAVAEARGIPLKSEDLGTMFRVNLQYGWSPEVDDRLRGFIPLFPTSEQAAKLATLQRAKEKWEARGSRSKEKKLLGKSPEDLSILLTSQLQNPKTPLPDILETARALGRELTFDEVTTALRTKLQSRRYRETGDIAKLLPETERVTQLGPIFEELLARKDLDSAFHVVIELGESDRRPRLELIFDATMRARHIDLDELLGLLRLIGRDFKLLELEFLLSQQVGTFRARSNHDKDTTRRVAQMIVDRLTAQRGQ